MTGFGTELTANILGQGLCRIAIQDNCISGVTTLGPERPGELYCSPGLIDLQINGYAGVDFVDPALTPEAAAAIVRQLWATGVTTFCPTLVTSPPDLLERNFRVLEQARAQDAEFAAAVPCYHLEGPYLSPGGSRGAHNPDYMHAPDWDEFRRFQDAAGGRIGILTVAPELPGAPEFIERVAESGVLLSVGHTDASARDIYAAARAGARMCTHLGNGCPEYMHRHEAPMWAQLVEDALAASMICDGFHLPPELVRVVTRMKGPENCVLVTDAIHLTGSAPGDYFLGTTPIQLLANGKVITRRSPGSMAGSTLSMHQAVERYQKLGGVSLAAAVQAATANPARLLGRPGEVCAAIETGRPANLVLWSASPLQIHSLYLQGSKKHG